MVREWEGGGGLDERVENISGHGDLYGGESMG